MTREIVFLTLPLPKSPNRGPRHHMAKHQVKRAYQKRCWVAAIQQTQPWRDPPSPVTLSAIFYVHNLRDEDNLHASLKHVLDALRQAQTSAAWRNGIYSRCGYFVDDSPEHLSIASVKQLVERKHKRLELFLSWEQEGAKVA